jgi:hypothetical protein
LEFIKKSLFFFSGTSKNALFTLMEVIGGKGVVMQKYYIFLLWLLPLLPFPVLIACAGKPAELPVTEKSEPGLELTGFKSKPLPEALDELAEMERSGAFVPGLGLAESKLREEAGDYAGAVLAVYKELSWAYSLGAAEVSREQIRQGLEKLLEPESPFAEEAREEIAASVRAILAYFEGRYDEAEKFLAALYGKEEEADSFSRFMLLVCALEKQTAGREEKSMYGIIRARYMGFPEYWYHLARLETADMAPHAERCINLAPAGPYAAECRIILAKAMGLKAEDAAVLKTRWEIETVITGAVNMRNPELLSSLLPLVALPDNPSTLYASGAMRALAGETAFSAWFAGEMEKARGRLAERLLYISRG